MRTYLGPAAFCPFALFQRAVTLRVGGSEGSGGTLMPSGPVTPSVRSRIASIRDSSIRSAELPQLYMSISKPPFVLLHINTLLTLPATITPLLFPSLPEWQHSQCRRVLGIRRHPRALRLCWHTHGKVPNRLDPAQLNLLG
jgi:hypothetical protein